MTGLNEDLVEFASRPLLADTVYHYWPVFAAAGIYAIFAVTSFQVKEPSAYRRAFLAGGIASIVYLWGFLTVWATIVTAFGWHGQFVHPHLLIRIGLESSVCLFAILLLLIPRNLICRRLQMPTAFTLGVGGASIRSGRPPR